MAEKLALGLYTVYDSLNRSLEETLKAVGNMGYDGVEFYGEPVWEPERVRRTLQESGLELCGWHVEWRHLQAAAIEETIAYHRTAGTPSLVVPALGGPWEVGHRQEQDCAEVWIEHARELNHLVPKAGMYGMRIGYHTHAHEFNTHYGDDPLTPWDILCEYTAPEIILELDTGNCIESGADPVKALRQAGRRKGLLHFKPYSRERGFETLLGDGEDANPWKEIVAESRKLDTEWFIIENEAVNLGEKLQVAKACLERLRRILT